MSAFDTTHECPRTGCKARVGRHQLACRSHWYAVSPTTRREVNAAYRSGDTGRHVAAMHDAIDEMNHPTAPERTAAQ
jgi:hypothetical protein